MNDMQHEQLFADLTPAQAAVVVGGIILCPYTTKGVNDGLNIRTAPSLKASIVGSWRPGEVRLLNQSGIVKNGFRQIQPQTSTSRALWVSNKFIQRAPGNCESFPLGNGL